MKDKVTSVPAEVEKVTITFPRTLKEQLKKEADDAGMPLASYIKAKLAESREKEK